MVTKIILLTVSLLGLWSIVFFVAFANKKPQFSNRNLIPIEVESVITIHSHLVIKSFLTDLLFKADLDQETAELFIPKKKSESSKLGVDLTSEIILFQDIWKSSNAKGVLVNITDEAAFQRYNFDDKNLIKVSNNKFGVIILLDKNISEKDKKHYEALAKNIIDSKYKSEEITVQTEMIVLEHRNATSKFKVKMDLRGKILEINGSGPSIGPLKAQQMHQFKALDSNYLELQTRATDLHQFNFLTPFIKTLGINIPKIKAQQIALKGITIQKVSGATLPIPDMDWIIQFEEDINVDSLLFKLNSRYSAAIDFKNQQFKIGEILFKYKQLSPSEIHIGVNNLAVEQLNKTPQFALKGNPDAILNIQGNNFVAGFIKMLPQVKYPKKFLEDIEHFNIHTIQEGEIMKIKGEIKMKEGKMMSIEMAKLVMLLL
ncbi:hypothetical protein [Brumimicrobium aurantiacum]|nr:hypothetical protein [Brumimicrobium aurantiacum]